MKKTSTQQANRRFHSKQQRATNGMNTFLRIFLLILLCGSLSAGTAAWSQTRSAATESARSTSRTPKATEAKTEKKASDARTEKKAAESRTEKKATETRSSETRTKPEEANKQVTTSRQEVTSRQETTSRQEVSGRQESSRNQVQDERQESIRQPASRQGSGVRQEREVVNGNISTRGADVREGGSRQTPSTRMSSGYRLVPGSRNPERVKIILPDIRFRHDHERCTFCFGVGFIYTHDRLHRLRCSQCYGRGFAVEFITRLDDVCPICYGPVSGYGSLHRRTIQNTASYVIDRLDYLLNLSRSQERAIKRIVQDYLRDSRNDRWYNPVVARDREIMRELSNRQRDIYMDFMNNLDSRDLCDRCFDYF
jgi:Skp family chaperone for outer membrane proteins